MRKMMSIELTEKDYEDATYRWLERQNKDQKRTAEIVKLMMPEVIKAVARVEDNRK